MITETDGLVVKEVGVLEKFDGEPVAENLVQRVLIENGIIVKVEDFENGVLVNTLAKEEN